MIRFLHTKRVHITRYLHYINRFQVMFFFCLILLTFLRASNIYQDFTEVYHICFIGFWYVKLTMVMVVVNIPVYGPAVAEKIRHRLLGTEGDDAEKIYDE